ncbi:MAG: condensation domain-containing protein, partial [Betaproteobacteria bacterium]
MQAANRPPVTARFSRSGPIVAPLSFAQQRMWVLHEIHSASPVYTLAYTLELRGPLDIDALTAALAALAHRHPALRTRFAVQDGAPVQVIEP